jgi:hypothetical protein
MARDLSRLSGGDVVRFLRYAGTGPVEACWLWTGALNEGYGVLCLSREGRVSNVLAHRVAHYLATGTDPGAACVLHRCDTRACVNPRHFRLGTLGDNNRDRAAKGRSAKRHPWNLNNPRNGRGQFVPRTGIAEENR